MNRLPLLLLLSLLLACPSRPANDDDDASNDDDAADDDDLCEGEDLGPIDLTSADDTMDLVMTSISTVEIGMLVAETLIAFGDGTCPVWDGPEVEAVDDGSAILTGDGCLSTSGYRYDGSAVVAWERDGGDITITISGNSFVMTWEGGSPGRGGSPVFETVGLDGTFALVEEGTINYSRSVGIDGWFIAHFLESYPTEGLYFGRDLFPEGFDGSWVQSKSGGPTIAETHAVAVNVDVRCRGPLTETWDLVFEPTSTCSDEPDSGTANISMGGHTVIVDPNDDSDCDGCFVWTLDGAPQPPLCPPS